MNRVFGNYEVTLRDEPVYSRNSADNPRAYVHEFCRSNEYQHVSAHGVNVRDNGETLASAILLGVGGATGVNENSLAFDGKDLYMASGDALYSLTLPSLELNWCVKGRFRYMLWCFLAPRQKLLSYVG